MKPDLQPSTDDYLEGLLEGFVAYDESWVMTYMNAAGERLLGRRREDVLGKTWHQAFPHAVGNPVDHMYQRVMRARKAERMEYQYAHYAGRWLEISASPVSSGGVAVYFRDVSDRKRAEAALSESEAKYRSLFESTDEGFCIVEVVFDPGGKPVDYRFLEVNPAFERQTGLTGARGHTMRELVPGHEPHWFQVYGDIARTGQPARFELPAAALGRWYDVHAWRHGEPHAGRVAILFNDMSARKEAEDALREADRRKDEFIATLSHELRNPLAPLANSLELLSLTGSSPQTAPIHEMMQRQVKHLVRLTDDLLELSRVTRGALDLRRERVELAAVVRNALETSDPLIRAAGRQLEVALPPQALWLDGDPVRLAQILANLLNNSAKYTSAGGRIELRARRDGGHALVTVRDDGAGIAAGQLPHVFEMFSRGERSSGLGIGLALARRLAEMHGGSISAASEGPGKGAEFTLRLPLAAASAAAAGAAAAEAPGLPHKRVLVVDDNRDAAESLGMLLKFLGADVHVAHGGRDALAAFDAYRPAMVLLDIGMPEMDGYEVAREIRARGARVPLVALTGWGQADDLRRAREAGFDHHMIKPPDIAVLRSLLGSVI